MGGSSVYEVTDGGHRLPSWADVERNSLYVAGSTVSGRVGMATVNLSWIFCRTSVSASLETNEIAAEGKRPA